jgi:hypothetical protein
MAAQRSFSQAAVAHRTMTLSCDNAGASLVRRLQRVARQLKPIDISNTPDLLKLAEEVQRSKEPYLLQRDNEDIAVLMPAPKRTKSGTRVKPVETDDALFRSIGSGRSGIPGGVSGKKHEYLARAYRPK